MLDILYVTHNRLEYTHASFQALLVNTDWDLVNELYVVDDLSVDGTYDYLDRKLEDSPVEATLMRKDFGGPVAAMNWMLDRTEATVFAKVDNDLIVPPGWLGTMLGVIENNPDLDALGTEPGFAHPLQPDYVARGYMPASHIGGQGLFRTRPFARRRPKPHDRFFGLTQFQRKTMRCGWVNPDIAAFNLDHLPFDPWRSLADEYVRRGWSRPWGPYAKSMSDYWDWWAREQVEAA